MTEEKKKSKTVKTPDEQMKEFGSVMLKNLAATAIPSDNSLKKIEELAEDVAAKKTRLAKETDKDLKAMLSELVQEKEYRLGILRSNLGSPANLSTRDRTLLMIAAKRLLKHDRAHITTVAQFVLDNVEKFPAKGSKY
jgi:hypothetical protein